MKGNTGHVYLFPLFSSTPSMFKLSVWATNVNVSATAKKKKNSVWPMIERQDSFSTLHTTLLIVAFQRRRHDTLTMIMKKCKRVIRSDLVKWWSLLITVTFLTEVINSNFRISICMVTSPINTERKKRVIMVFFLRLFKRISTQLLWRKANAQNVSLYTLYGGQFTFSTQLISLYYPVILSQRSSTTVAFVP